MGNQVHDRIVIGASAGGVEVLKRIVRDLPTDLPAAILVVLHLPPTYKSFLPEIFNMSGSLNTRQGENSMVIENGNIYTAAPGLHLLMKNDRIKLDAGPKINGFRPAIDALFTSAAEAYGKRVIGIVLTGMLDDGTEGLIRIKEHGGLSVVQDPDEASFPDMPLSAIDWDHVDYVKKSSEMADTLVRLARGLPVEFDKKEAMERWKSATRR